MARSKKEFDLAYNHAEPYFKNRSKFDKKLSKIGEPTPIGPRLRRVWGCAEKHFRLDRMRTKYLIGYAMEKSINRDPVTGMLYEEDYIIEIGMPRHIIEVYLPPSYFGSDGIDVTFDISVNSDKTNLDRWEANWDAHRYEFIGMSSVDEAGEANRLSARALNQKFSEAKNYNDILGKVGAQLVDILGPFPRKGEYRFFYTIEDEEGEYKDPDDNDLAFIKESYTVGYLAPQPEIKDGRNERDEQAFNELFDPQIIHKAAQKALEAKRRIIFDYGKNTNFIRGNKNVCGLTKCK